MDVSVAERAAPDSISGYPVEVRQALQPRSALEDRANAVRSAVRDDTLFDLTINFRSAEITFSAEDDVTVRQLRERRDEVEERQRPQDEHIAVSVLRVSRLAESSAYLMGGRALSSCTSGFPIRTNGPSGPNHQAVTTAGHCPDQSFGGCSLPTFWSTASGNYDRKAMGSGSCNTMPALFYTGIDQRTPSGTTGMFYGYMYCKYGMTTGHACGEVVETTYDPGYLSGSGNDFRIVEHPDLITMAAGGDSGGPWFVGTNAAGITSGVRYWSSSNQAIVSPHNRVFDTNNYRLRTS